MASPIFVLQPPHLGGQPIVHPYLPAPPVAAGSRRPNGTIIVTDENFPSILYKLTPWENSSLAFREVEAYSRLRAIEDQSGIVQLWGISGSKDHFIRAVERSHRGSLDRFLLDAIQGDFHSPHADFVRSVLAQIAQTMTRIHALNFVHRDLKAENVLVFDENASVPDWRTVRAKVSDFDRAIELLEGNFLEEPVGSLFHMAPELLARGKYNRKVDVYAFGVLMFEIAHGGSRPYPNVATGMPDSIPRAAFADKVINEEYRPIWLYGGSALKHLAMRCWSADPADRPEFSEIVGSLQETSRWLKSPSVMAMPNARGPLSIDTVGIAATIGEQRRTMEDASCVLATDNALIAGVFDGLRGSGASEVAAQRLALTLADIMRRDPKDPEDAIRTAFDLTEYTLRRASPPIESGSTATVALLRNRELFVSWLGDSPAYLFRSAKNGAEFSVLPLVLAHHPDRADEATAVKSRRGEVRREQKLLESGEELPWGPLRVFAPESGQRGGVALSRAFGIFPFKPALGSIPQSIRVELGAEDFFLVIGSDGVFEVLTPEAIYRLILAAPSMQKAADVIIAAVLAAGAPDNASVVVIDVRPNSAT